MTIEERAAIIYPTKNMSLISDGYDRQNCRRTGYIKGFLDCLQFAIYALKSDACKRCRTESCPGECKCKKLIRIENMLKSI